MPKMYDLRLKPGFPGPRRARAGIEVPAGSGIQTELTDEQLKAFKADPEVVVREISDREAKARETLEQEQARTEDQPQNPEAGQEEQAPDPEAEKRSEAARKAAATRKANKQMVDNQAEKQA